MTIISRMHRFAGVVSPTTSELEKLTVQALAKTRDTDQKRATPVTQRDAERIRSRLSETLKDARDLALKLVGRDLLSRASELVSLEVSAFEFQPDGTLEGAVTTEHLSPGFTVPARKNGESPSNPCDLRPYRAYKAAETPRAPGFVLQLKQGFNLPSARSRTANSRVSRTLNGYAFLPRRQAPIEHHP